MFEVGEKVICVDADHTNFIDEPEIHKGGIYTIRWIGMWSDDCYPLRLCVHLCEIDRSYPGMVEHGESPTPFLAARFRPIVSRPTSIAVFEKILRKSNAPSRIDEVVG